MGVNVHPSPAENPRWTFAATIGVNVRRGRNSDRRWRFAAPAARWIARLIPGTGPRRCRRRVRTDASSGGAHFHVVGVHAEPVTGVTELGARRLGVSRDAYELDRALVGCVIVVAVGGNGARQHLEALCERNGVGNAGNNYVAVKHEAPLLARKTSGEPSFFRNLD